MRKSIVLIMLIALTIISCSLKEEDRSNSTNSLPTARIDFSGEGEIDKEENKMKREFCVVNQIQEAQFVLKNTSDELYYIDNSFLGGFKEGDKVLLLYRERDVLSDGKYSADVYAIYPDDDTIVTPR